MKLKSKFRLDRVSIKWRLFAYLAAFVAFLLILLWLFQIVFLDEFYKTIKSAQVRQVADSLAKNIGTDAFQQQLDSISPHDDICVRVVDSSGSTVYSRNTVYQCVIHKIPPDILSLLFHEAQNQGGSISLDLESKPAEFPWDDPKEFNKAAGAQENGPRFKPFSGEAISMVYGKITDTSDGQLLVLVNSLITPVDSTVETLRIQLICITILLLILSVGLAAYLSRKISDPIIRINQSAGELASGNYDVTFQGGGYREINQLRDTLNYAARELAKVEGLRREFIANVSHDLRTPLTMITGYAEMMRDIPGENSPHNIQVVIDEANRLTGLVNDILDISKIQAGAQSIHPVPFDITDSILRILDRYRQLVRQQGYHISFAHQRHAFVLGDEARIGQVIYNLINNAITYTGEDKQISIVQLLENGQVTIQVTDTGPGIAPENLPYIWDRYYKVVKAHKRAAIGTGLGLSIVKGIVNLHGGECGVESVPGHGSTFWFRLPEIPSGDASQKLAAADGGDLSGTPPMLPAQEDAPDPESRE